MQSMIQNFERRYVGDAISAGSSIDGNSSRIDMQGYESVMFIVPITDSVATGVATLKIEENDADSDTGMTAVDGASAAVTCAVNDDVNGKVLVVEYRKTAKRYVQAVRTSSTANIAYGAVIAILKPYAMPSTQHSTEADNAYVSN